MKNPRWQMTGRPPAGRRADGVAWRAWRLVVLLALALSGVSLAADYGNRIEARVESAATPWTGLEANDADEDFTFVVVADRTRGHRRKLTVTVVG